MERWIGYREKTDELNRELFDPFASVTESVLRIIGDEKPPENPEKPTDSFAIFTAEAPPPDVVWRLTGYRIGGGGGIVERWEAGDIPAPSPYWSEMPPIVEEPPPPPPVDPRGP